MKNYQQKGDTMPFTAGADTVSGQVVKASHIVGVSVTDVANGATGELAVEGVFLVPKTTGTAWANGLKLNWDVSAGKFDSSAATPATGDITGCAVAFGAALSGDSTAYVKLTPGNTDIT